MTFGPNDDVALAEANDEPAAVPLLLARTSPCVAPFPGAAAAERERRAGQRGQDQGHELPHSFTPLVVGRGKGSRIPSVQTRRGFSYGFQFLIDESISASRQRSKGELRSSGA